MKNRIKWLAGAVSAIALIPVIILMPYPSVLRWQSEFLGRAMVWLLVSTFLCLYRIFKGPTTSDRVVAIDMLGILIVGFCAILSLPTGRDWYIDIGIAWALQSFIGIMALAKNLEGKDFDE